MNWLEDLQQAIDYIEEHLLEPEMITSQKVAKEIFASEYNFRTLFRVITGYAVGEYIRNRRLSMAGEELLEGDSTVLDIAVKYGYDTAESFTKAFTRFHGQSPSQVRKSKSGVTTFTRMVLKVQACGGSRLDYSIEELPAMCLIGYEKAFNAAEIEGNNAEIPKFIRECYKADFEGVVAREESGKFKDAVIGYRYDKVGIMYYAFGVIGYSELPEDRYKSLEIPKRKWLCFPCENGGADTMQNLWYRIYTEFMPFSSYEVEHDRTLEVSYCRNGRNEKYLYIPLRPDKE